MAHGVPSLIAINHDDYHANHVGHTSDGRQFFLTTPFRGADYDDPDSGCEYVALFLFDADGALIEAKIDDLGPRASMDMDLRRERYDEHLATLGDVTPDRIEIAPFSVERFGTIFGLIPRAPEDVDDGWAVILHPGDYMAFFEPWDGTYDT